LACLSAKTSRIAFAFEVLGEGNLVTYDADNDFEHFSGFRSAEFFQFHDHRHPGILLPVENTEAPDNCQRIESG
jgi:hypothetical protein